MAAAEDEEEMVGDENAGESHTPSFAAPRRAMIASDSDDDGDDGDPQSHEASLPPAAGTKRARQIDSSDDEAENYTEATPSFAKRIYEE